MTTLLRIQFQRMPLSHRWDHLRYDLWRKWHDDAPMWIAWHLPRRVALWAMIRVAGASGKGPSELTYESMHRDWEEGAGR